MSGGDTMNSSTPQRETEVIIEKNKKSTKKVGKQKDTKKREKCSTHKGGTQGR